MQVPAPRRPAERTGPVVARALQILGAFTPDRRSLTLSELARHSHLPVSTAHRLASELVAWGALERDVSGCYRIGLRLWEIGSLAPRGQGLRECALPFLEDLSQVTRENVQLAVREGPEVVFVERIAGQQGRAGAHPGRRPLRAHRHRRRARPARPRPRRRAGGGPGRPIKRYTDRTLTTPHQLRATLADTRARGYAISDRQVTMDALSVAAPIQDARGRVCRRGVSRRALRQRLTARARPARAHQRPRHLPRAATVRLTPRLLVYLP